MSIASRLSQPSVSSNGSATVLPSRFSHVRSPILFSRYGMPWLGKCTDTPRSLRSATDETGRFTEATSKRNCAGLRPEE
eukprot:5625103-Alexandrium_andersonii.AAC.1